MRGIRGEWVILDRLVKDVFMKKYIRVDVCMMRKC